MEDFTNFQHQTNCYVSEFDLWVHDRCQGSALSASLRATHPSFGFSSHHGDQHAWLTSLQSSMIISKITPIKPPWEWTLGNMPE